MKARLFILVIAFYAGVFAMGTSVVAATNDISGLLQKGLFEEEANRNLDAAISAYQAVVAQMEKDHQFAATAVFRLAECYRKLGRTNEATAQYQRVLREFSDQTELVKLSQEYVSTAPATNSHSSFQDRLQRIVKQTAESDEDNEVKRIQAMIKDSPDLINAYNGQVTPLITAVQNNRLQVVSFLLDNKADTEVRDRRSGMTPLMDAAGQGNVQMVELLLKYGADVNAGKQTPPNYAPGAGDGDTALHYAAQMGFKAVAETLLAHGANVNAQNSGGQTPLYLTAEKGYRAVAEVLLAHGADLEKKSSSGASPLYAAVDAGNRAMGELLLANKADVNGANNQGWNPLIDVAAKGNKNMVEFLLANKADVNSKSSDGTTPLIAAASNGGHLEVVKFLLDHGADVNVPRVDPRYNPSKFDALYEAINRNDRELAELLLNNKADPDAATDFNSGEKFTALSLATQRDETEIVRMLLEHKADPNRATRYGATSLHWATQQNVTHGEAIADLLLSHGADVNARDENGQTPLHWAAKKNAKGLVELLVAHHADVNAKDDQGNTPLDLRVAQNPIGAVTVAANGTAPLSYQWTTLNPGVPGANPADAITDVLRAHGAITELERGTIRYVRTGMQAPTVAFRRGVPLQDNLTLFDLIALIYAPATWQFQYPAYEPPGLKFPDFSNIKITRLQPDGRNNDIKVNLKSIFDARDCAKNVPLQWGDVVEIPELDHNVKETWRGLHPFARETLKKCLERHIEILVKGQTTKVTLMTDPPYLFDTDSGTTHHQPAVDEKSPDKQLLSPWLNDVVYGANVILASSDLTRVKLKRTDSATHQTQTEVYNLEKNGNSAAVLLRDGDVIEIPEKQ